MINALEKVVYPNGKTQSLAEIGGAVEGLSALIDEVDKNTSAISSITSQLAGLVDNWQVYHEFEKESITPQAQTNFTNNDTSLNADFFRDKKIKVKIYVYNGGGTKYEALSTFVIDGNEIYDYFNSSGGSTFGVFPGTLLSGTTYSETSKAFLIVYLNPGSTSYIGVRILNGSSGSYPVKVTIYTITPPTRTAKKKAVVKKKGDSK